MKNIAFFFLFFIGFLSASCPALAQAGGVFTVAGGGTSTADGVPATNASLSTPSGVATDGAGNIYVVDRFLHCIKMVSNATGLIYNIAGNPSGPYGFSGDGGPATAAIFSHNIGGIHATTGGDIYIADDTRVRKIDGGTGIITTVAGGGSSLADGVAATMASLSLNNVFVDVLGNIYVGSDGRIKKIDAATGLITTIAGGGTSTADGIPATSALVAGSAECISMDNMGNLYIIADSLGGLVRKIDAATGLIHTVAGGGGSIADGIPATNMHIGYAHSCRVDGAGNIFIADWINGRIRRVDAVTGLVNTIAGSSGGSYAEGTPALAARVEPYMIWLNTSTSKIYYSDYSGRAKSFTYSPMVPLHGGTGALGAYASDSMFVSIYGTCSGPQFTIRTYGMHPGMTIRTYFGDGNIDTTVVTASWSGAGGYVYTSIAYPVSDTYLVKHVLCNYGVPVDSISYSYHHLFCSQMSLYSYSDANGNCIKDGSENFLMKSSITAIDSNGVTIDTVVSTGGFSYRAYGSPGDIYCFRVISSPDDQIFSCPVSGITYDTLFHGVTENAAKYAAFICATPATSDLAVSAHVPVTGPSDQWGHIYVRNNGCIPTDASVTLHFSPKYRYIGGARPVPTSSTSTSLTWNLANLSSADGVPQDIYFEVWHNFAYPYPVDGDTVNEMITVTPLGGVTDVHTANNMVIRTDTVRTSCDPNEIVVSPSCFDNDTTFRFTVHFENIGSAPAENIYVMDTLSPWFDASTIDIEMSTHTMFTSKQVANGRTIYRFDFPNINLADSSDHANRDGAFMYTIKNKPGIPTGIIARSRVGIYFDYNDVLLTNTVENRKGCPTTGIAAVGTKGNSIAIYPNPTSGSLTIDMGNTNYSTLSVTNAIGQVLLQQVVANPQPTIDVRHLPAGIYYVALRGSMGTEVRKFVKW